MENIEMLIYDIDPISQIIYDADLMQISSPSTSTHYPFIYPHAPFFLAGP